MKDFEELPVDPEPAGRADRERGASLSAGEDEAWRQVRAGLLVDLGLADRVAARSWQQAVRERRFQPRECADEILARSPVAGDDVRVVQRAALLLRDLLMAPLARGASGAGRRLKRSAQGGVAFVIAQGVAFGVFCLIVLAVAVVLRLKGHSLDGWLDLLLGRGPG